MTASRIGMYTTETRTSQVADIAAGVSTSDIGVFEDHQPAPNNFSPGFESTLVLLSFTNTSKHNTLWPPKRSFAHCAQPQSRRSLRKAFRSALSLPRSPSDQPSLPMPELLSLRRPSSRLAASRRSTSQAHKRLSSVSILDCAV